MKLLHLTLLLLVQGASASSITLKWIPNPTIENVAGYRVYYGTAPGVINGSVDVGTTTTKTFDALTEGKSYYFAVSAIGQNGFESKLSGELPAVAGAVDSTFTIALAPSTTANSYIVSITRKTYTAPVNLNVSGLPDGTLPPKFSTNPVQTKSTLTIPTTACTAPGSYTFTVVGFGCSPPVTRTATGTLTVK